MNINIMIGYLVAVAILAALSALIIKLAVKLVAGKSVNFGKAFVISFISFLITLFFQMIFLDGVRSRSAFIEIFPAFVFFFGCWLLNAQWVEYGEGENPRSYGKAFLVTIVQCVGLFISLMIFSLMLVAVLSLIGPPPR